jgi:hypothetical protein
MLNWPHVRDAGKLTHLIGSQKEAALWTRIFNAVYLGKIDTWDYQWAYANWINERCGVLPAVNLISNVGFGADATHTVSASDLANLSTHSISFPLFHPANVIKNESADAFTRDSWFMRPLWLKIVKRIAKQLRALMAVLHGSLTRLMK